VPAEQIGQCMVQELLSLCWVIHINRLRTKYIYKMYNFLDKLNFQQFQTRSAPHSLMKNCVQYFLNYPIQPLTKKYVEYSF